MSDKRNVSVYLALNGQDFNVPPVNVNTPSHNIVTPTDEDYKRGSVVRYFVKKINNDFAYETTSSDFGDVDGSIWQKISLVWKITGTRFTQNSVEGIEPHNRLQVSTASVKMPEISKILTNPTQFAHFS